MSGKGLNVLTAFHISVHFRSQQKTYDVSSTAMPELIIARLYPHHARLALEGLVSEIEEKPDRVADRMCILVLKENSRCADIARDAGSIIQLHR